MIKGSILESLNLRAANAQARKRGGSLGRGWLRGLRLLEDPRVRRIRHFRQDEQIVAAKGLGGFPLVALFVEAAERDVVAHASFSVVALDGGFDGAEPDLVGGAGFVFQGNIGFGKQCHRLSLKVAGESRRFKLQSFSYHV